MVRPETWKLGRPRMPSALFADSVARLAGDDRGVGDLFHQPGAEHWSRDAEDHVVIGHFGREVRLLHRAGRCRAGTSVDREQRVDAPVRRAVVIPHEAGLAYRPVDREERRDRIRAAIEVGECDLGIDGRARSTDRRLRVTAAAAIEVHSRSKALVDLLRFVEVDLSRGEIFELLRGESRDRRPRRRRAGRTPGSVALTAVTVCDAVPI